MWSMLHLTWLLCAVVWTASATPSASSLAPFTVENQLKLTGFLSITCDEVNDAYTFKVANGLAVAMDFRVDLSCSNADARNSVGPISLAPYSHNNDSITIKPLRGTVKNQKCTLSLVGKDVYGVDSTDHTQDHEYASKTRLCGRSLFDGAFDDDDDDCNYFLTCLGTRNWWHNGMIYWITYSGIFVIGWIAILVYASVRYNTLNNRLANPNLAGSNPASLRKTVGTRLEDYTVMPFGSAYVNAVAQNVNDLRPYEIPKLDTDVLLHRRETTGSRTHGGGVFPSDEQDHEADSGDESSVWKVCPRFNDRVYRRNMRALARAQWHIESERHDVDHALGLVDVHQPIAKFEGVDETDMLVQERQDDRSVLPFHDE